MREPVSPIRPDGSARARAAGRLAWAMAAAACVLTALLAVVFATRQAGQVTRPSAEIYFNNSPNIATWTNAKSLSFSFVVHNLANNTYDYRYEIYMSGKDGKLTVVDDKVLTLGPQQGAAITETLQPSNSARFQVTVSLPGTKSSIFFWTQKPASRVADSKH